MDMKTLPRIIQGGMGVDISHWGLAKAVSMLGQLGTVSGVALDRIMARKLQRGDPGGHIRRALKTFPFQDVAERVLSEYFVEEGIPEGAPFKGVPKFTVNPSPLLIDLTVSANYAFVWLAKEGHDKDVSINYLEKIALTHVYAITGAMLAGVNVVTMGAGLPFQIPGVLDGLAEGRAVDYRVPVIGEKVKSHTMNFDPKAFFGKKLPWIKRPKFYPIVASYTLAYRYAKKMPAESVQGLVFEEPTAGGHNASPRRLIRNELQEPQPIYGDEDIADYGEVVKLLAERGLPFWIGGSYASPEKLNRAISMGAAGIQAGSIFALCEQSGLRSDIRKNIRRLGFERKLRMGTDMLISPTGFPFKVACLPESMSEAEVYDNRVRICNQGALVELYERPNGTIGYRCAAEPVERFIAKGGIKKETVGRGCLCNGLVATAGLGDPGEAPIVTLGDDVEFLRKLMKTPDSSYTAEDAIKWLLGQTANLA